MSSRPPSKADADFYAELRGAIEQEVPDQADREVLIAAMENLESVEDEAWESAYEHFVKSAQAHLAPLGRFLAKLEAMLGA